MIIQVSIYIRSHMFQIVNKKSVKSDTVGESLEGTTKKFASGVIDIVKTNKGFLRAVYCLDTICGGCRYYYVFRFDFYAKCLKARRITDRYVGNSFFQARRSVL